MTANGKIKYWHDKKGYGFILPDNGGEDVFFHISNWHGTSRPQTGLAVRFSAAPDRQGRNTAVTVSSIAPEVSSSGRQKQYSARFLLTFFAVLLLGFGGVHFFKAPLARIFAAGSTVTRQADSTAALLRNPEIQRTIALIQQGGPFPYPEKDGSIFRNLEGILPAQPYGYYREYTVTARGAANRGARRIITGGKPPQDYYYTADHYRHFVKLPVRDRE